MADELNLKRIIELQQKTTPEEGDSFAVDNPNSGTNRITIQNILDPTFSSDLKAAPAAETKKKIDEVMDTFAVGIDEAVDNWMDRHPEASTTVQDGSITEQKLTDLLILKTVNDYVTPEMYGAKGDGQTDDTAALKEAFTKGNVCLKRGAIYKCSNVDIVSNSVIIGNGATIDSGNASGFIIKKTVHDVLITDITFESVFTVGDTETPSNVCILIEASNTTEEYEAYNIEIERCTFNCGVFGIAGTSVKNLYIHDCEFYGGVYRPEDLAGGYAILTQSCINVTIERCYFKLGKYSRHDIYVSVSQSKTDNIESKNYRISNCYSDKSLITEHENDAFYSPTIISVVVRSVYNFILENYRLYNGTGLIAVNGEDGLVVNAIFKNCINDTPRFKASSIMPSEARQAYQAHCQSGSSVTFENCELLNSNTSSFLQYSVEGGLIEICNTTINGYIEVKDCEFLHLHDLFVKGAFFRFTGNGVLYGKFHSLESDGSYNFGSATNVSNGAYIDINAYDDDLLGPWQVSNSGALTFVKNKLHVPATCVVENNNHGSIITLSYTKRPSAITRAMSLTDGCVIEANVTTSNINDNQVRLRNFKLADGTAAANRVCRFYLC